MADIRLADSFPLPAEVVTETMAALGRKGSGKTYLGGLLFEQMVGVGAQCLALDPVGVWYGLRLSASGKGVGLDIPVLGGDHGDVPLQAEAGALIARVVVERNLSAVIDISDFRKGQMKRFATDFAEEFFQLKKRKRSPVHLFIEEARTLVPQKMYGELDPRMVGAFEDIVRRGRNYGIGCTMLDQRPQSVNKEVLSQVEILIAMQTVDKLGRKEIEDWVRQKEVAGAEELSKLATLQPGEAFIYSPGLLKTFARVKIGKKKTYNASKTPELGARGEAVAPKPLSDQDLAELRESMKEMVADVERSDPALLRRQKEKLTAELMKRDDRIRALETELDTIKTQESKRRADIKVISRPVLTKVDAAKLDKWGKAIGVQADRISAQLERIQERMGTASPEPVPSAGNGAPSPPVVRATTSKTRSHQVKGELVFYDTASDVKRDEEGLTGPEQRILDAMAWLEVVGIAAPENVAVAFVAGYRPGGGAYANPRGRLRSRKLIDYVEGRLVFTPAGRGLARLPPAPPTAESLHRMVLQRLKGPERRILKPLLETYPDGLYLTELAAKAGYEPGGGAFNNPRGRLRTLGLITYQKSGFVRASDLLFPI